MFTEDVQLCLKLQEKDLKQLGSNLLPKKIVYDIEDNVLIIKKNEINFFQKNAILVGAREKHEKSGGSWLQSALRALPVSLLTGGAPRGISLVGVEPTSPRSRTGCSTTEL